LTGLLLLGGAVVLLLARRPKERDPEQDPAPEKLPPSEPSPGPVSTGGAPDLFGSLIPPGAVAGALAFSYASGELAYAVGNTELSRTVGRLSPGYGVLATGYAKLGEEIDKQLGGEGGGVTGTIAQGGLGAVAWLAAGGLAPLVGPLGVFAAIALFPYVVLAYIVGSIWTDSQRLSKGQAGARDEYFLQWWRLYDSTRVALEVAGLAPTEAPAVAMPYAHGYCAQFNRLAYEQWMRKPWGLGQDRAGHAKWGRDRAYFYGETNAAGDLVDPAKATDYDDDRVVPSGPDAGLTVSEAAFRSGRLAANARAYVEWMRQPRGYGQSELSHLNWGRSEGRFQGDGAQDGALVFEGVRIFWRDTK
jgi:hypothetical protein